MSIKASQKKSLAELRPEIAAEWDYERNAPLTPRDVTVSSGRKVWWTCDKGHHWEAIINNRTGKIGSGCPYCAGKLPIPEETDLGTLRPDVAAQWNYEKNAPLTPQDVTVNSGRKVWWVCDKGHHWDATVYNRTRRNATGCPCCAGKLPIPGETDLGTLRPEIASEWDYERNDPLTPQDVTVSSHKKVWWACSKGHHWETAIYIRTRRNGSGCPGCNRPGRKPLKPIRKEEQ